MPFIRKHHLTIFFVAWFLLYLVQAANTELLDDEAYYWIYSRFLDWGYFDHPPMIALMIRAGFSLFHNELGVRLLMIMLSTCTLAIIYQLLPRKNNTLFYAIACSFGVLQIGGMLAVPDIPLAFFVALFFLAYRNFLRSMSWRNTFLLGTIMALMLYSKYQGVLVIACTFISYPKLAATPRAYIAVLTGAILFFPHLYWQYTHHFPSVQFHLFERNASEYSIDNSLEYIIGQLLLPGPLMGWMLLWAAFRYKTTDAFEKALKFSMAGLYLFFLASTLRGKVEPNWTVPVFIPVIVLSHQFLLQSFKWQRMLIITVPVSLLFVMFIRIYMMLDIYPWEDFPKDEFHKNKTWAENIHNHSEGRPVVFIDSYQKASKYYFYSGIPAFSLNTPRYRRNNFNFWPIEGVLNGKSVAVVDYTCVKDRLRMPCNPECMLVAGDFFSFSSINILAQKKASAVQGMILKYALHVTASEAQLQAFQLKHIGAQTVQLWVMKKDSIAGCFSTGIALKAIRQKEQDISASFRVNLPKGVYTAKFALPSSLACDPSLNSSAIPLEVE